jgi:hypothetical protein
MARVTRRPEGESDVIEIWIYIAEDRRSWGHVLHLT